MRILSGAWRDGAFDSSTGLSEGAWDRLNGGLGFETQGFAIQVNAVSVNGGQVTVAPTIGEVVEVVPLQRGRDSESVTFRLRLRLLRAVDEDSSQELDLLELGRCPEFDYIRSALREKDTTSTKRFVGNFLVAGLFHTSGECLLLTGSKNEVVKCLRLENQCDAVPQEKRSSVQVSATVVPQEKRSSVQVSSNGSPFYSGCVLDEKATWLSGNDLDVASLFAVELEHRLIRLTVNHPSDSLVVTKLGRTFICLSVSGDPEVASVVAESSLLFNSLCRDISRHECEIERGSAFAEIFTAFAVLHWTKGRDPTGGRVAATPVDEPLCSQVTQIPLRWALDRIVAALSDVGDMELKLSRVSGAKWILLAEPKSPMKTTISGDGIINLDTPPPGEASDHDFSV